LLRQLAVQHVELALDFHRIAVDRVLQLLRRIGIEVAEAAAQQGRGTHLPEQPVERFGARRHRLRQEGAELFGQVEQDRTGFEHAHRLVAAAVHQRRDLRVRVDLDEAARELRALVDADQPGIVFGARMAGGQQLLQHDRDLLAVRRGQRIQLQRMLADR
jgi:hypothetical protein